MMVAAVAVDRNNVLPLLTVSHQVQEDPLGQVVTTLGWTPKPMIKVQQKRMWMSRASALYFMLTSCVICNDLLKTLPFMLTCFKGSPVWFCILGALFEEESSPTELFKGKFCTLGNTLICFCLTRTLIPLSGLHGKYEATASSRLT